MGPDKQKLTLQTVAARKEAAKRFLANGRYMTTGTPRRGGIATVHRAFDTHEERYIALKVFRSVSGTDDVVEESFRRETQALSDLKHRNIVQILDSGFDMDSGEHYIAMEWVEKDLEALRDVKPFSSWTEFFDHVGRQILEGLAFAHIHATVHRDIKPTNILVTPEGVVKVCDFGISKIRNFLEPGVTLAQYASLPFAPPEVDDGTYSYSRDVFGFAALSVAALSAGTLQTHRELVAALELLQMDDGVRRLLRRCLSVEVPKERPQNAAALIGEFERIQPKRQAATKGTILVAITNKVRDIIEYDLGLGSDSARQKFVEMDLGGAVCEHEKAEPRPHPDGSPPLGRAIRLYGSKYGYVAIMTPPSGEKLRLVSALEYATSDLERCRSNAAETGYHFALTGVAPADSALNIAALNEALTQFTAEQKVASLRQREQAIYQTWRDLLNAKTELERERKRRLRYSKIEPSGSTIRFDLPEGYSLSALEEQDIRVVLANGYAFLGTVVSVGDNFVVVQPSQRSRVDGAALPEAGTIEVDTTKAEAALSKQTSALDAVRFGRSVDPLLGGYIISPTSVPVPPLRNVDFLQTNIDDDKKDAVRLAMSRPPLMIVQGPPGTGKTTFITELVLQTLQERPESRILLTSQTHVALDNSLERINKESAGNVQAVRIGHESDVRISASTKGLLVENKLPVMRKAAIAQGKEFIERWAAEHKVDLSETRMAMALERHAVRRERQEYVEGRIEALGPMLEESKRRSIEAEELAELDSQLDDFLKERDALGREMKESLAELRRYESDKDFVNGLAQCSAAELRTWAETYAPASPEGQQMRKLLKAHAEWEERFGRSRDFRAALIASSQVVAGTCLGVMSIPGKTEITYDLCIVDEASIATPTEVLVPMSRARRTVLVGDDKQLSPFQDPELRTTGLLDKFGLKPAQQRATLFNHLNDGLPAALKKALSTQHRMLPAIGNLISSCFYGGELQSLDRQPAPYLSGILPRAVVWYSTSRRQKKNSRLVGTSHYNDLEVQLIVKMLAKADFTMRHGQGKNKQLSVAVLTGYGEQRRRLRQAIDTRQHEWVSYSNIYVNVVDAFQGREADMLVFSVTRSDAQSLGFLREMERVNVALSRGKELLAIVGDHVFCQEAEERTNPLKGVLEYIRGNPRDCVLEEVTE